MTENKKAEYILYVSGFKEFKQESTTSGQSPRGNQQKKALAHFDVEPFNKLRTGVGG